MKAISVAKHGDPSVLKLEEISTPKPQKGEALVRLKAAGLNFIDIYMRMGRYLRALPYTAGLEGAGIVEELGEGVTEVKPGDRVAYAGAIGSWSNCWQSGP